MNPRLAVLPVMLIAAVSAQAHHSFAPHFDREQHINIAGTITRFEQRNPHAYLHVRVEDADGRLRDWNCESHGVTQLTRNGITPDMLSPGNVVRIEGSRHRRDPYMCFFDIVELSDGRVLSVNGPEDNPAAEPGVAPRDSIFGTWLLVPANRATSGPQFMMDFLTAAGQAAVNDYNPFTDDPTYRCEPVAIRRAWFAPGTPMAIRQEGGDIVIQHEWMDVERVVHMNQDRTPASIGESILGYSRGRWEGDTLVVETDRYNQGVLNQFVEVEGQPMRGLLHSNALRTVERIRFDRATNRIRLTIDHDDPVFFTRDFPTVDAEYAASDLEIQPFGCMPEQLI